MDAREQLEHGKVFCAAMYSSVPTGLPGTHAGLVGEGRVTNPSWCSHRKGVGDGAGELQQNSIPGICGWGAGCARMFSRCENSPGRSSSWKGRSAGVSPRARAGISRSPCSPPSAGTPSASVQTCPNERRRSTIERADEGEHGGGFGRVLELRQHGTAAHGVECLNAAIIQKPGVQDVVLAN